MPFADQLVSVECVETLARCLSAVAPDIAWTETTAVPATVRLLRLSDRVRAVRDALLADLPSDYRRSAAVFARALRNPDFTGWMIWPVTEAVAARALASADPDAFEAGLSMLARLTTRLTGEFAIRAFLNADLDRTLRMARTWATSDDEHVRRLATEGTRPRLPWAKKVPALVDRPDATMPILDALRQDGSEYVRRSVANHLNDISRIAPDIAVTTARRWSAIDGAVPGVVRHGLRTLVKEANPAALALLGFGSAQALRVDGPHLRTTRVVIGQELEFDFSVTNTSSEMVRVAIDYVVHYRKANGSLAPRVYKLTTRTLAPGEAIATTRRQPMTPLSTRRHYRGEHAVELQVNGARHGRTPFDLVETTG